MSSEKRDDGGPAFPTILSVEVDGRHGTEITSKAVDGMSLRDYFAAEAIASVRLNAIPRDQGEIDLTARMAYAVADAMLAERAK